MQTNVQCYTFIAVFLHDIRDGGSRTFGDIIFGGTLSKTWHLEVLGFNACVSFRRDNRILVFIVDQILIHYLLWVRNWRAERRQVSWGLNPESVYISLFWIYLGIFHHLNGMGERGGKSRGVNSRLMSISALVFIPSFIAFKEFFILAMTSSRGSDLSSFTCSCKIIQN